MANGPVPTGPAYIYRAEAKRIIDGDSLVANVNLGFEVYAAVRIRIRGVDAPEMSNKPSGADAGLFLWNLLLPPGRPPSPMLLRSYSRSFERWVADLWVVQAEATDWVNVADLIIAAGHGLPYPPPS